MLEYTAKIVISVDRIRDLMVGAAEGPAIAYWATDFLPETIHINKVAGKVWYDHKEIYEQDFKIKVITDEGEVHFLTPEGINKGLQIMADKYSWHLDNIIRENDDATTADVFIQLALFGDIIYG